MVERSAERYTENRRTHKEEFSRRLAQNSAPTLFKMSISQDTTEGELIPRAPDFFGIVNIGSSMVMWRILPSTRPLPILRERHVGFETMLPCMKAVLALVVPHFNHCGLAP